MKRPPKLTSYQRQRLSELESSLREAVRVGDYERAKTVTAYIQELLRPTGHETRLMRAKNWLFECAMEAGELNTAISGFIGVRGKTGNRTRVYLEATALLAICYIRQAKLNKAEPLIREALRRDANIASVRRRVQFKRKLIERFEEEGLLQSVSGIGSDSLDPEHIYRNAGDLVRTTPENDIITRLADSLPPSALAYLLKIDQFSRKQLPADEKKLLPPPFDPGKKRELGEKLFSSFKRVLWRSICDPNSAVYKMWCEKGLMAVWDEKVIAVAVASVLVERRILIYYFAVAITALIVRFGLDLYCERYKPEGIMS
jgi:hypothetical protein